MKKYLISIIFIFFTHCVKTAEITSDVKTEYTGGMLIQATLDKNNNKLTTMMNTEPSLSVIFDNDNARRLIFICENQNMVISVINQSFAFTLNRNLKSSYPLIPDINIESALKSINKYVSEEIKNTSSISNDMRYVKSYMILQVLNTLKGLQSKETLQANAIDTALGNFTPYFNGLQYSKKDFNALAFSQQQKDMFVTFLKENNKSIQDIKPLFPPDYIHTKNNVSIKDNMHIHITYKAGFDYGKYGARFSIAYGAGNNIFINFYNIKEYTEKNIFEYIVSNLFSKIKQQSTDQLTELNNFKINYVEAQIEFNAIVRGINNPVYETIAHQWYFYGKKLTVFMLKYLLDKTDKEKYKSIIEILDKELIKYKQELEKTGEGRLLTKNQEKALAKLFLGTKNINEVNLLFNLPEDQYKQAISKSDIDDQSKKQYKQIKEPIKQQTKFERLYSLLPNKYVLGGGLATGLLVWYMLRNYAPTLPKLQKYLTPQWFGKK